MTREEFFYKYGCECKDPNCSSVVKEKCSAEFYRDLDSIINKSGKWEIQKDGLNRITHCICSECKRDMMDYFYSIDDDGEWLAVYPEYCPKCGARNEVIVSELIEGRAIVNPNPKFKAEDEFIERLKLIKDAMSANQIAVLVESFVQEYGPFSNKNGDIVRHILSEVLQDE